MADRPTVYVDLDGTILDVEERYYRLHRDLAQDLGSRPLSRDIFWTLKRRCAPLDSLLEDWDPPVRKEYGTRWRAEIESPAYLRFDCLIEGSRTALETLTLGFTLKLVTMRRDVLALHRQLANLSIGSLFEDVIAAAHHPLQMSKADLVTKTHRAHVRPVLVVGDTEADVEVARRLRTSSACVLTGIRERAFLEALSPNYIVDSICDVTELAEALSAADRSVV